MKFTLISIAFLLTIFAQAQLATPDVVVTDDGDLIIQPIIHGALVLTWNDQTIYVDPYGGAVRFEGLADPDIILITDIHGDHLNQNTLNEFNLEGAQFFIPQAVYDKLPEEMQQLSIVINNGENIAVITYDLQILPTVAPLDIIPNTGTIKNYASTDGGPNFANGLTDDTDVTIQGPEIAKSLVGTSIIDAFNSNTQAVIGEIATFKLDVKIPRGTTPDAVVVDSLPAGLAFQQMVGTPSIDAGISFTGSLTPVLSNDGKTVTFNLGDVTNTNVSDDLKGFTVEYEAVVLNVRSNQQNTKLTNNAKLDWLNHPELPAVTSSAVTVIEPTITVNKTVSPSTAQAGDMATFTIDISAGTTTAHDVNLKDILPGNITSCRFTGVHQRGTPNHTCFVGRWFFI